MLLPRFDDLSHQLQEKYYAHVPFSLSKDTIEAAVASFFRFLNAPESIKSHMHFSIAPQHRRGDIGFQRRNPEDHMYNDSKEFFHFHPAIFEEYNDFLQEHPIVLDFMHQAKVIWNAVYDVTKSILGTFEPYYPGASARIFETKNVHILVRFLKYDWQESGEYLAKPHFDAGSFTLALAESCTGLRIGKDPQTLKCVEPIENNALFMIASNYEKVLGKTSPFHPGWHDVIQQDLSHIGKPFARWAVVAFIEAHGVDALPRSETHKWYRAA